VEVSNSHLTIRFSGGRNVYISIEVTSRKKVLLDTINGEQSDDSTVHKINKQPYSLMA
jgi:hypothetical protein